MKNAYTPNPQRKTPTWKHPWCGLTVPGARAGDIAKVMPSMVRPIAQRAQGPRDHKSPLGVMLMYSGTSHGTWSSGPRTLSPENLPRFTKCPQALNINFAEIEARVLARYSK